MNQIGCNSLEFIEALEDVEAIQVLYYLERYNPDVGIQMLSDDLEIKKSQLIKILKNMIKLEIIAYRGNVKQYNLTPYGRNIVNALHQISLSNQ